MQAKSMMIKSLTSVLSLGIGYMVPEIRSIRCVSMANLARWTLLLCLSCTPCKLLLMSVLHGLLTEGYDLKRLKAFTMDIMMASYCTIVDLDRLSCCQAMVVHHWWCVVASSVIAVELHGELK